jgi:hypothetical protein
MKNEAKTERASQEEIEMKTLIPRILGTSNDRTECDCCGRNNLKRTVALDFDGDVRYYGVDCAAAATRVRKVAKVAAAVQARKDGTESYAVKMRRRQRARYLASFK